MDSFFIFGAKYLFLAAPLVALWVFLKLSSEYKKKFIKFGALFLAACFVVGFIAGKVYYHEQPFVTGHFIPLVAHAVDNSFPSHHTLFTAAIAGLVWFYHRRAGYWLWLVAIVVGLSRIYVGLHYPIDILVSLLIPLIFVIILRPRRTI